MKKCLIFLSLILLLNHCSSEKKAKDELEVNSSAPVFATVQIDADRQGLNDEISSSRQNTITRAVADVSPAVVGINVTKIQRVVQRSPFDDDPFWGMFFQPYEYQQKVKGLGSGFLISPDGYILSNDHVVHQASEIIVTTTDGKQFKAEIVGEDQTYDVTLLKIDGKDFPYIHLGDSDDIIIGEWVIAFGNPFGLFDISSKPTVTVGVVSAIDMNFLGELAIEGRSYREMIQTDAAINGGNSGGPLVNSLGQCIGINTFIISGSNYQKTSVGIGFAIPINRVKKILPDLKKIGRVDRSFSTGLEVENISWLVAQMLGISPRDGVIVSRIGKNSQAEKAGLKVGDVIVSIDERRVHSTYDVQQIINAVDITETNMMKLNVYRDGKFFTVKLELERT